MSPLKAQAIYAKAWALEHQDKLDEAIALYEQVPDLTDTELAAQSLFMQGEVFFRKKEHTKAIPCFFKAAFSYGFEEWASKSLFEAGRCFEVLKNTEKAIEMYQELICDFALQIAILTTFRKIPTQAVL